MMYCWEPDREYGIRECGGMTALIFVLLIPYNQFPEVVMGIRLMTKVTKKKSKAVPLHAMEAHGVRGGIAPTHS
jgi:hypothetical protein